ncbi:hypothetical protein EDB81DRAFT_699055 [Neofusicoccum parvum]|uniref:Uncharacterized protein n=1 Tax=Neofusicoccum parvum TaxID=310453 RepID=A0ACB5SBP8_9PEZI|nr:hypothetical protein EDB81DRAFT_699055 [Neofusicoccum parvum]
MASFSKLIRFECEENDDVYFADLGPHARAPPLPKTQLKAYRTIDGLVARNDAETVTIRRLLAPVPREGLPIYCVGLNYRSHAKEVNVDIPKYPPLWTKPATSLAHPGEEIVMQNFCASSLPDYEGELAFVTSKKCRDVSVEEAEDFILGYTVGNDLSCRKFQLHSQQARQFFFAKAFDKFAPIGPMLLSPRLFANSTNLTARVNGEVCQVADFKNDMIFSPKEILSHMSQGTATMLQVNVALEVLHIKQAQPFRRERL